MRLWDEDGQSLVFVALCMSIFLLGALGLGIDGAHLYAHRQMAQTAADAAAQAAIMSIFDGTNGAGSAGFTDTALSSFTCSTTDTRTPCAYARNNGFGGSASDTVTVDFPADASYPGVSYSSDPVNLARVTVVKGGVKPDQRGGVKVGQ